MLLPLHEKANKILIEKSCKNVKFQKPLETLTLHKREKKNGLRDMPQWASIFQMIIKLDNVRCEINLISLIFFINIGTWRWWITEFLELSTMCIYNCFMHSATSLCIVLNVS